MDLDANESLWLPIPEGWSAINFFTAFGRAKLNRSSYSGDGCINKTMIFTSGGVGLPLEGALALRPQASRAFIWNNKHMLCDALREESTSYA
jgi:hypothetical protein